MKFVQYILLSFCILFIQQNIYAENNFRLPEKIFSTQNQQYISLDELLSQLKSADIVLIGEQHNQNTHHLAEEQLLKKSEDIRKNGSVILEMINADQQSAISEVQQWLNNGGKTGVRNLENKINWQHSWNWQDYGNIVHYLLKNQAVVLAGLPNKQQIANAQNFIPQGKKSSADEVRAALLEMMMQHIQHGNPQLFVNQQQFKDNYMAQQLLNAPKPAYLIAGAVHTAKNIGVPLFLQDADYQGKVLVIILTADNGETLHSDLADIVWYLPKNE